jgi:hypothetical protein
MDIEPQTTKPISDDQELAKVLAGVSRDADNLNFEETPISSMPVPNPVADEPEAEAPKDEAPIVGYNSPANDNLDSIKKSALVELRPLVDKLDLLPEEKFDIYLLMLRSTDDKSLIAPAHETARGIADESKRAQALLDIIKEIDYLSNPTAANN